jgi:hypothetical protein
MNENSGLSYIHAEVDGEEIHQHSTEHNYLEGVGHLSSQ